MYTDISECLFNDVNGLDTDLIISDQENYIQDHRKRLEELTKRIYTYVLNPFEDPYKWEDFYILKHGFEHRGDMINFHSELYAEQFFKDKESSKESECDQLYPMFSLAKSVLNDFDFTSAYQKNGYRIIRILNHIFMINTEKRIGNVFETKVIVKTSENEDYWFDDYLDIVGCNHPTLEIYMVDVIECLEQINTDTVSEDMRAIIWCLIRLIYCYRTLNSCGIITP